MAFPGLHCKFGAGLRAYFTLDSQGQIAYSSKKRALINSILEALDGVHTIYTYNDSRFDLPFIHGILGIDLSHRFSHHDLIPICRQKNIYFGVKSVE